MGNKEFSNLLNHLESSQCITGQDKQQLSQQIITDEGLKLLDLIVLFSGSYGANDFLCSLPIDLKETASPAGLISFADLIAVDFACETWNNLSGWKSIYLISFKVKARKGVTQTLTWTFPFGSCCSSKNSRSYHLIHHDPVNVNIEWPVYSQRAFKGDYRGALKLEDALRNNIQETHVVGKFLTAYEQAPRYAMTFTDSSYAINQYTDAMTFLFTFFNIPASLRSNLDQDIKELARKLRDLGLNTQMTNVGFVLEKTLSNVFLKEIGGDIYSKSAPSSGPCDWWPFLDNSFLINSLRVIVKPTEPLTFSKILAQLDGSMTGFKPAVPFRLLAGVSAKDFVFKFSLTPDENRNLSVREVLNIIEMSSLLDISKTFPSVSNLTNSVSISTAALELGNKGISSFHLGIDIDDWKVIPGTFEIAELSIDIYSTFPLTSKQFGLSANGVTTIAGLGLGVALEIQNSNITFQLLTVESPLTLRSILDHFFHQSNTLFPQTLLSILNQVEVENVAIEGNRENDKWSLSRFSLSTAINVQLDISDNFSLSYPKVVVDVAYPFTANQRKINTAIAAVIELSDTFCETTISWTGENSSLSLMIQPLNEPLLLQTLIGVLLPKDTTLSVPPSVSFLLNLGLANAQLTLSLANKKSILTEISATIVSTSSLRLWTGLDLTNILLHFSYSTLQPGESNKSVILHATLQIANTKLDAILSYGNQTVPVVVGDKAAPQDDSGGTVTAKADETWIATVTYDGEISILDIMSSIAEIDLRNELSSVGLSALRDMIDIELSNLKLVLTRQERKVSFVFDAHVKYLFFDGPVHLICAKSPSWTYSFTFGLSPEKFLSNFGIQEALMLTDTIISLEGAKSGLSLGFKTTLVLQGTLKNIGRAINVDNMTIEGSVSDKFINLAITTPAIAIFNDMRLAGSLIFSFSTSSKVLKIAIQGKVSNISFPQISSEKFTTTFSLFVKLPNPELGFACTVDKLTNAFGLNSLNFKDLLLSAAFQEFPFPSEVAITGAMDFQVENQKFVGSLAIYFSEFNLTQCGTKGNFKTFPTLNQALQGFDSVQRSAPKAVDGTFIALEYSQALQEVTVGNVTIKQGLELKGDLRLPCLDFETFFEINVAPLLVHISGYIKNAIVVEAGSVRLFALTNASDTKRGPSLDLKLETTSIPTCHSSGVLFVLGLSTSVEMNLYDDGFKYNNTIATPTFTAGIKFAITKTYLDLYIARGFELSIPYVKIGGVSIPKINMVKFDGSFHTKVNWSNVAWNLEVTGHVKVGDWDLGTIGPVTIDAKLSDFEKITEWLINWISQELGDLLKKEIGDKLVSDGLNAVIKFLKTIGLGFEDIVNLLTKEFGYGLATVIKEVTKVFGLGVAEVAKFLKNLGHSGEEIARLLRDALNVVPSTIANALREIGFAAEDVGRILSDVFGLAHNEVFKILKDVGFAIDDVTRAIGSVFNVAVDSVGNVINDIGNAVGGVIGGIGGIINIGRGGVIDIGSTVGGIIDIGRGGVIDIESTVGGIINIGRGGVIDIGSTVGGIIDIGSTVGGAVNDVGNAVGNAAGDIIGGIGGLFG